MRYSIAAAAILLLAVPASEARKPARAKNVILFLADAGGVATMNAASILGHGAPQKLFVQSWPDMGLSDTSPAGGWVTDSAAGMTAIVTGVKTLNGVVSQGPDAVRGKKDGAMLKTILEHAEERGLSTGVLTNVVAADATPAACYAHVSDRRSMGEVFLQALEPLFGDGVDVVMGLGRQRIYDGVKEKGKDLDQVAAAKGRRILSNVADIPESEARPIVLAEKSIDLPAAARRSIRALSANKKGYFLMIEWDTHTDDPEKGLNNMINFDKLIREIAGTVDPKETLLVFTADHSFDLRVAGGKQSDPLLAGFAEWKKTHKASDPVKLAALRVDHSHTGEEVVVAARGPGAERVRGFLPNTRIFDVMMAAYGWKAWPGK